MLLDQQKLDVYRCWQNNLKELVLISVNHASSVIVFAKYYIWWIKIQSHNCNLLVPYIKSHHQRNLISQITPIRCVLCLNVTSTSVCISLTDDMQCIYLISIPEPVKYMNWLSFDLRCENGTHTYIQYAYKPKSFQINPKCSHNALK